MKNTMVMRTSTTRIPLPAEQAMMTASSHVGMSSALLTSTALA
jgi:hypothetical protein